MMKYPVFCSCKTDDQSKCLQYFQWTPRSKNQHKSCWDWDRHVLETTICTKDMMTIPAMFGVRYNKCLPTALTAQAHSNALQENVVGKVQGK